MTLDEKTKAVIANPETLDTICQHVANGGSLIDLCQLWEVRYSDIHAWIYNNADPKAAYEIALKARGEWFVQRVLKEFKSIAILDLKDAYDEHGNLKDIKDIPANVRAAIASIETEELYSSGRNPEYLGRVRKIKFNDKLKALELIGKNLFMFVDRIVHQGNVAVTHKVDTVNLDERIKQIVNGEMIKIEAEYIKNAPNQTDPPAK